MNDSGAAGLSAGTISARIDRLPATRTIWTIVALLGFGMFFEFYDLLFSAYVAPSLVKSGLLTATTTGLFGTAGVASFIAALVHRAVHRNHSLRLSRRPLRPSSDLHVVAALVFGGERHGGAPARRRRPQFLAPDLRHWPRRRDGDDRRLSERACAQGPARARLRCQPGDRLRSGAGCFVPGLYACSDGALGTRGLALGGADRSVRRAGRRFFAARPCRKVHAGSPSMDGWPKRTGF